MESSRAGLAYSDARQASNYGVTTVQAVGPLVVHTMHPLDRWCHRAVRLHAVGQDLVHDVLGGGARCEDRVAIAARDHEVILGDLVAPACDEVARRSAAAAVRSLLYRREHSRPHRRRDVIGEAQAAHFGDRPSAPGIRETPFSSIVLNSAPFAAAHLRLVGAGLRADPRPARDVRCQRGRYSHGGRDQPERNSHRHGCYYEHPKAASGRSGTRAAAGGRCGISGLRIISRTLTRGTALLKCGMRADIRD